jgi:AAA family ATPase
LEKTIYITRTIETLYLISSDMISALTNIRPSAMREVLVDVPKVTWEDIGGQWEVKQKLKEAVEWPLQVTITCR